jgi:uncharacterized membrane protein
VVRGVDRAQSDSRHPFSQILIRLLTPVVSLEAIFLSTFVLISQSRGAQRDMEREENDLRVSVLTGVWAEQIGDKLGVRREEGRASGSGAPARGP